VPEILSGNLERLFMVNDIVGTAQLHDPPESAAEVQAILNGDPSDDLTGDPLAGPDGIVFANWVVLAPGEDPADFPLYGISSSDPDGPPDMDLERYQRAITSVSPWLPVLGLGGDFAADCSGLDTSSAYCYCELVRQVAGSTKRIVGALPVGMLVIELVPVDPGTGAVLLDADEGAVNAPGAGDFALAPLVLPLQTLRPLEVARIARFNRQRDESTETHVVTYRDPATGGNVTARIMEHRPINPDGTFGASPFGKPNSLLDLNAAFENGDQLPDLDENGHGILDLLDDGTRGPVDTGALRCGSGIPGDILQYARTVELTEHERLLLASSFPPDGIPLRSPVFCPSTQGLLALLVEDPDGERRFAWQTGEAIPDADADAVEDAADNCPYASNPLQEDRGGVGEGSGPDGIGDACQCGDVSGDGRVDAGDVLLYRRHFAGVPSPFAEDLCSVVGGAAACDATDVVVMRRTLAGLPPGVSQHCAAANPPAPAP